MFNRIIGHLILTFPTVLAMLCFPLSTIVAQGQIPTNESCSRYLELQSSKESFLQRRAIWERFPENASENAFRAAAKKYVELAEQCYEELNGPLDKSVTIDDGGVLFTDGGNSADFVTFGTKWGDGSPFTGGQDVSGPGIPGGEVTYSFMTDGVDLSQEAGGIGSNVALTSLPDFTSCFQVEIEDAFAAWAAIANVQFKMVADDGLPFNQGLAGDIRIGAHIFDGPSGTLAHGFYPPPNGVTAAGDIHFDVDEGWSCDGAVSTFDIGIVAIHEIGHALGLLHEVAPPTAVMNPTYNPALAVLQPDDIIGIDSIYGSAGANCFIDTSKSSYANTEDWVFSTFTINNPTPSDIEVELKVWVENTGQQKLGLLNMGSDGSFIAVAETVEEYGPAPLTGSASAPPDTYLFGCRLLDPISGELYSETVDQFTVQP